MIIVDSGAMCDLKPAYMIQVVILRLRGRDGTAVGGADIMVEALLEGQLI